MQIISVTSVHTANSAGVLTLPANLVLLATTPSAQALVALMNAQPAGLVPTNIELGLAVNAIAVQKVITALPTVWMISQNVSNVPRVGTATNNS